MVIIFSIFRSLCEFLHNLQGDGRCAEKLSSSLSARFMLQNRAMKNKNAELALLPNGFVDLLPPKAEGEAQSISVLMEKFKSFGYERIKPPLLEFEDSLLGPGPGERLAPETFRLMDPVSHRMLGIRSDITPQIVRIATSRLSQAPRPLRLTYANDALRTRAGQMRTERQFTQVGCEIIGDAGVQTDIEICVLAVLGLRALGIKDITLDFNIPGFVSRLTQGLDTEKLAAVQKAVAQRDHQALSGLLPVLAAVIEKEKTPADLRAMRFEPDMSQDIKHLCDVYDGVAAGMKDLGVSDVHLSVDVLEQAGFEYHERLGFTLFAKNVHGELGRGGSYDVRFGQADTMEMAKGFTLYMDTVGRACQPPAARESVFVSAKERWGVIEKLQGEGWVVVRGNDDNNNAQVCTHIYENGKIRKKS